MSLTVSQSFFVNPKVLRALHQEINDVTCDTQSKCIKYNSTQGSVMLDIVHRKFCNLKGCFSLPTESEFSSKQNIQENTVANVMEIITV